MRIVNFQSGLGNQVFFYLMAKYLESKFPNEKVYGYYNPRFLKKHNGLEIQNVFNIELPVQTNWSKFVTFFCRIFRRIFPSIESTDKKPNNNAIYFRGYWQNKKYFLDNVEKLEFRPFELDCVNLSILDMIRKNYSVSIHVRRGDYVAPEHIKQYGGICTVDYYNEAISRVISIHPEALFFVFSNDIEWVKNNLPLNSVVYVSNNQGEKSYLDLFLMTHCNENIIANSSFSYWGAMLNKNKQNLVYYPGKWFNTHTPDIFPSNWISL